MKIEQETESDIGIIMVYCHTNLVILWSHVPPTEPFSQMDTMSQPFTSQSQGYCSYSQQQQAQDNSSKVENDDNSRGLSVEEIIRCHTAFMSKGMYVDMRTNIYTIQSPLCGCP